MEGGQSVLVTLVQQSGVVDVLQQPDARVQAAISENHTNTIRFSSLIHFTTIPQQSVCLINTTKPIQYA